MKHDPRRQRPIRIQFSSGFVYGVRKGPPVYRLVIDDNEGASGRRRWQIRSDRKVWAAVEWSPERQRWCIEDAAGRCLAHVEHQHGEAEDKDAAIALAKRMIGDGTIPSPEDAERAWRERQDQQHAVLEALEHPETLFEAVDDFLAMCGLDVARSNSFQRLRAELIRHVRAWRQKLDDTLAHLRSHQNSKYYSSAEIAKDTADAERDLARANEMLERLGGAP